VDALQQAFAQGQLGFHGELKLLASPKAFSAFLRPLFRHKWVVYCKPPFGGSEYVLHYLGAYTHRVAISHHRLVSLAGDQVTFRWRDSTHANQQRLMNLSVEEFLRRFLLHVLRRPRRFSLFLCDTSGFTRQRREVQWPLDILLLVVWEIHGLLATPSRSGLLRCRMSGRRRRACALATVRRSNCTYGFPVCSSHEDSSVPGGERRN